MATYVIGDVQGCFDTLQALLDRIEFDPSRDRLWLVGDLVNRGPKSLQVLRWARGQGERVTAVLGNHDLHLLACAAGAARPKKGDTLEKILNAHDSLELIDWLRHRPLVHVEDGHVLVHAGLHPLWSVSQALALGAEVTAVLRAADWRLRIGELRGPAPAWAPELCAANRLRAITSIFLRVRTLAPDGRVSEFSGPPGDAPRGHVPWFEQPAPRWTDHCVVFGHWSALGLKVEPGYICLDSGCVWGRELSALRLEDRWLTQIPAVESKI